MMHRRDFITLLGGAAAAWPLAARAQQAGKVPTIGYLGSTTRSVDSHRLPAFTERLRELGWIDGRTVDGQTRTSHGCVRTTWLPPVSSHLASAGAGPERYAAVVKPPGRGEA